MLQGVLRLGAKLQCSSAVCAITSRLEADISTTRIRQHSTASPSFETEQEKKNYELLLFLMRRPVDTAARIASLAGLGAAYRDLSAVMDHMFDKDVRGYSYPEISEREAVNTLNNIKALQSDQPGYSDAYRQLKLHLEKLIPELSSLQKEESRAAAIQKLASCTEHDQLVIKAIYPQLRQGETDGQGRGRLGGGGGALSGLSEASSSGAAAFGGGSSEQAAAIGRIGQRFARVRYPVWDVTKYDDDSNEGQTLRPRFMDKVSVWQALLPPHMEVSYQTMTAIPLFPMQEAVYPTFVDFDLAMNWLSVHARRNR